MERAAEVLTQGGRFRFEAFLLHARLLREFLWDKSSSRRPGAENSLLAEHYFAEASDWRGVHGGLTKTLRATKDRIDRQIAHLARDRHGSFKDLEVEVPQILAEVMAQWTHFEAALPPEWAKRFDEELRIGRCPRALWQAHLLIPLEHKALIAIPRVSPLS